VLSAPCQNRCRVSGRIDQADPATHPEAGYSCGIQADKRFLNQRQVHELADACGKEYRLLSHLVAPTGFEPALPP
jgi:hypothetical protein